MRRRIIVWLIRTRLCLGIEEPFQFVEQNNKGEYYYFTKDKLMKYTPKYDFRRESSVSLNWLLNDDCRIIKIEVM